MTSISSHFHPCCSHKFKVTCDFLSSGQLIKVYSEDRHSRSVWVSRGATARDVCHMLVQTAHCSDQENWALLELHPALGLGEET